LFFCQFPSFVSGSFYKSVLLATRPKSGQLGYLRGNYQTRLRFNRQEKVVTKLATEGQLAPSPFLFFGMTHNATDPPTDRAFAIRRSGHLASLND
jgi:hypothetical protein